MESATTNFDESILRPIKKKRQEPRHRVPDPENRAEKRSESELLNNRKKSLSAFERMLLSMEQEQSSSHLQGSESETVRGPAGEDEDKSARHTEWRNFITSSESKQPRVFGKEPLPQLVPKKASTLCTGECVTNILSLRLLWVIINTVLLRCRASGAGDTRDRRWSESQQADPWVF